MQRLIAVFATLATGMAFAAEPGIFDWPQWRGPDRTGLSKETGLLKDWPKDGPKQSWKITGLGEGYSTPSISAGRIYLLGTKGNDEHLFCLNEKDGSRIWDTRVGTKARVGYAARGGTPTIADGFAYSVSSDGNLTCVEIAKGNVKWQKHFIKDFGGQHGSWAYAESPLIDGDRVICTPGSNTAVVAALKAKTGEVVWKTAADGLKRKAVDPMGGKGGKGGKGGGSARGYAVAGYSSVVPAEICGVKQYVQFVDGGLIGVAVADGKVLWHYEDPASSGANISTPIVRGDLVFAVSAYSNGGGQAKIVKDGSGLKAEQQYFLRTFQNHHGGVVLVNDHMYGTVRSLYCIDFKSGKTAWDDTSVGKGSVSYADGHLYVRGEGGKVALVEANPNKYVEKGQFLQPDRSKQAAWPHPVVANGNLYLRDWDILLCYDVKNK